MTSLTLKRIMQEAKEIANNPSDAFWASPTEESLFEWHFVIRGAKGTDFEGGLYHGRILLPPTYPLRPPAFKFSHTNGRFEVNREVCLSISRFHEASWSAAWGIRTAILALVAFMPTKSEGAIGGIDMQTRARMDIAINSPEWKCPTCAKMNKELLPDLPASDPADLKQRLPNGLQFAYTDQVKPEESQRKQGTTQETGQVIRQEPQPQTTAAPEPAAPSSSDILSQWIDRFIIGICILICALVIRRFV